MEKGIRVIYVDLDQTLVCIDLLQERLLVGSLRAAPLVFKAISWFLQGGRVRVKMEMMRQYQINPAHLPYNKALIEFLQNEKQRGVRLVLATGAPRDWAESIAKHLGIFDHVLATDLEAGNLKGSRKLKSILRDAGGEPFGYAGDAWSDLPVLEAAQLPIVVGGSKILAGKKAGEALLIKRECAGSDKWWMSLRLHQWSKNMLVFTPVIASHRFDGVWGDAILGFLAFGCTASALYILNDLYDVDLDRQHLEKRRRSFATGTLWPLSAVILIAVLGALAAMLTLLLPAKFALVLICYALINLLYSHQIKNIPALDVVTLAFLYSIRVFAGGTACGISISTWLAALTFFLALSLAHLKRYLELVQRTNHGLSAAARPAYMAEDSLLLALIGVGSGLVSVLITVLYITSPLVYPGYKTPRLLFVICMLQFYWIERMWLLAFRGQMSSDPIGFIIRDKVSYGIVALVLIVTWAAVAF
jgi:4-hydroxybenzoate polyprenyltransferase/phosphoserine phosphatase